MNCKNCNNQILGDGNFCGECGAKTEKILKTNFFLNLYKGRLGRMRFFLGYLFNLAPLFLVVVLWGFVIIATTALGGSSDNMPTWLSVFNNLLPILIGVLVPIFFIINLSLIIRRLHDLGWSGWLSILCYIPYLNIIPLLILLFKGGEYHANKFGVPHVKRKFLKDIFNY